MAPAIRLVFLSLLLCLWAQPSGAADKIPLTIGAVSSPVIASDAYYSDMESQLGNLPGKPFDIKLMVHGELGSDESHVFALRRGRIQIAAVGTQSAATAVPELTILNTPYLLESWPEIDYVYDNTVIPFINELLAEHGIIGLRIYGAAWHGVYAKVPIYEPVDAIGKRFRALVDPASQAFVRALGADTFQVAAPDVVTALQTGLIEAGETNSFVYSMTGTATDAPYFTLTRHTPAVIIVMANKRWFDNLPTDLQQVIMVSHPTTAVAGAALRADEERMLAAAAKDQITLIEPTTRQRAAWRAKGLSTHRALIDEVGGRAQELYDLILSANADFAAQDDGSR